MTYMLGKVLSDYDNQFIELIEIGDLSMGTKNISVKNLYQPELLEELDGTPESSLTTSWLLGDHGLFRVHAAIIRPKSEQAQHDVSLSRGKTEDILKAIPDIIVFLEKKPRRYEP